jgi:hypothetical protein
MIPQQVDELFGWLAQPTSKNLYSHTSAFGPKRTSMAALQMSAFGGKADMMQTGRVTIFRFYSSGNCL